MVVQVFELFFRFRRWTVPELFSTVVIRLAFLRDWSGSVFTIDGWYGRKRLERMYRAVVLLTCGEDSRRRRCWELNEECFQDAFGRDCKFETAFSDHSP